MHRALTNRLISSTELEALAQEQTHADDGHWWCDAVLDSFVGSGGALSYGGPASVMIGFSIIGVIVDGNNAGFGRA
ncbi:hypothetical protein KCU71_g13975, partial [Aureobasidium melanogenum]